MRIVQRYFDMRDLGAMLEHEEPVPHPVEDSGAVTSVDFQALGTASWREIDDRQSAQTVWRQRHDGRLSVRAVRRVKVLAHEGPLPHDAPGINRHVRSAIVTAARRPASTLSSMPSPRHGPAHCRVASRL
jgi:hypothetical protein